LKFFFQPDQLLRNNFSHSENTRETIHNEVILSQIYLFNGVIDYINDSKILFSGSEKLLRKSFNEILDCARNSQVLKIQDKSLLPQVKIIANPEIDQKIHIKKDHL